MTKSTLDKMLKIEETFLFIMQGGHDIKFGARLDSKESYKIFLKSENYETMSGVEIIGQYFTTENQFNSSFELKIPNSEDIVIKISQLNQEIPLAYSILVKTENIQESKLMKNNVSYFSINLVFLAFNVIIFGVLLHFYRKRRQNTNNLSLKTITNFTKF